MAANLITAPDFRLLQQRLLADLTAASRCRPLAPNWVVVPSATLANHLRVQFAAHATAGALAGVRVLNLPRLAGLLADRFLGRPAPPWSPVLELALFEVVDQLPDHTPLGRLKQITGGATLLRQVVTDLAEGGFGPANLELLAEMAADPALAGQESAVLQLYARWVELLEQRGLAWAPLTLQQLPAAIDQADPAGLAKVLAAETGQEPELFVYGFYEWLEVHRQWLAALARRIPTQVYYPWQAAGSRAHPAFAFAEPILADLRMDLGDVHPQPVSAPAEDCAGAFFLASFPEGEIGAQPAFVSYQRASGSRAEAVSAALRVRRWLDDPVAPLRAEEILVVAPQAEQYTEAVREMFAGFGIPLRISDVAVGPAPEQEPLRLLARLWEDQAPAEWVLAFLRACPASPLLQGIDLERFERKVRDLGLWGGSCWQTVLDRAQQKLEAGRPNRWVTPFDPAEQQLLSELAALAPADTVANSRLSVRAAGARLENFAQRWLGEERSLAPLLAAVRQAAAYAPDLELELRQWARWLAECAAERTQRDPQDAAVLLVPLMRARGLTAKALVVLGLAAGQFPPRVQDDPILSESASAKLVSFAGGIGHRLPLKSRLTEEMRLLFYLLNSAADRVHWVVPETDADGKAVAPTPWVQRYLQRWDGSGAGTDRFSQRLARSPLLQAQYLASLDPVQGRYLPPRLGLFLAPDLDGAAALTATEVHLLAAAARLGTDLVYSGGIQTSVRFPKDRLGVTRLELLAKCPFRFLVEAVAGWRALEPLSLSHGLDPMSRGTLVHELLCRCQEQPGNNQPPGARARALLAGGAAAVRAVADQLAADRSDRSLGLMLLPPVFRRSALEQLVQMAAAYFEWAQDSQAVAAKCEQETSRPYPGLAGLVVTGKIDQINQLETGWELLDFKTGKRPSNHAHQSNLGWLIQGALYPWLCQLVPASFQYLYLGGGEVDPLTPQDPPDPEQLLAELAVFLKSGAFLPAPPTVLAELAIDANPCHHCAGISACRRFAPLPADRTAALWQHVAPDRVGSMQRATTKNAKPEKTTRPQKAAKPGKGAK